MKRALRLLAFSLVFAQSCGRTGLSDDAMDAGADAGPAVNGDGGKRDAGQPDAGGDGGSADAGTEQPFGIVVARTNSCPAAGTEQDMRPSSPANQLVTATVELREECSGAGGEWIVGQSTASSGRFFLLGGHACWFLRPMLSGVTERAFGVVRYAATMVPRDGPTGWCITRPDGGEPVRTADDVAAVALFRTRAGADAARAAWNR